MLFCVDRFVSFVLSMCVCYVCAVVLRCLCCATSCIDVVCFLVCGLRCVVGVVLFGVCCLLLLCVVCRVYCGLCGLRLCLCWCCRVCVACLFELISVRCFELYCLGLDIAF